MSLLEEIDELCQRTTRTTMAYPTLLHISKAIETLLLRICQLRQRNFKLPTAIRIVFPGELGKYMVDEREPLCFKEGTFMMLVSEHMADDISLITSAMEYFCHELLQTAEIISITHGHGQILSEDLRESLRVDHELGQVFYTNQLYILQLHSYIPRHSFRKVVKELVEKLNGAPVKVSKKALDFIQCYVENVLFDILERANLVRDASRNKMIKSDIEIIYKTLRGSI